MLSEWTSVSGGARVAKAYRVQKPLTPDLRCYSIYFGIQSVFFNRARAACGLSAKLAGTGFAVARGVLEKLGGWRTGTITEDVEFSAQLACAVELIWWVPRAISYDEEPATLHISMKQRKRWCTGCCRFRGCSSGTCCMGVAGPHGLFVWTPLCLLLPYTQVLSILTLPVALTAAWLRRMADFVRLMLWNPDRLHCFPLPERRSLPPESHSDTPDMTAGS